MKIVTRRVSKVGEVPNSRCGNALADASGFDRLAHGVDDRIVVPDREAKSISHETTFATDLTDMEVLRTWLQELTEQVAARLKRQHLRGRTVNIKLRFANFRSLTRSRTLPRLTTLTLEIWRTASELLTQALPAGSAAVRLLGVGLSGLTNAGLIQQTLFVGKSQTMQRQLGAVTDAVRESFGTASHLSRGSSLLHDRPNSSPRH